jgi:hypothetical protein
VNRVLITLGVLLILWLGLNFLAWSLVTGIDGRMTIVILLLAAPVYWLVSLPFRHKPFAPGRCKVCGYDLTGNASGTCPECGGKAG